MNYPRKEIAYQMFNEFFVFCNEANVDNQYVKECFEKWWNSLIENERQGIFKEMYQEELNKMEQLPQTQISLVDQLAILRPFANKLGLYDAADYIKK